jgi:Protein of unknown function (DUF1236)
MKADPTAGSTTQKAGPSAEKPGDAKPSVVGQGASPKSSDKAGDPKPSTSGQGAAGAPANLSTEQRTTIRTVIKQQNVQPVTNVNFTISIGTRVPRTVHFYPVPDELVRCIPAGVDMTSSWSATRSSWSTRGRSRSWQSSTCDPVRVWCA